MGVLGDVACIRLTGQAALGLGLRAEWEGEVGRDVVGRLVAGAGVGPCGSSSQGPWACLPQAPLTSAVHPLWKPGLWQPTNTEGVTQEGGVIG